MGLGTTGPVECSESAESGCDLQDVNPDDPEAAERFQELVAAYNSIMGHLDFSSADEGIFGDVWLAPPKKW